MQRSFGLVMEKDCATSPKEICIGGYMEIGAAQVIN